MKGEKLSLRVLRPEDLLFPKPVSSNNMIGRLQDVLGGPVILLKSNDFGLRKVFLKIKNVPDLCPSPTIDRLIIVPDHTDILMSFHQTSDEMILDEVGVLEFVYHHVSAEILIGRQHLWEPLEQDRNEMEEILKIQGIVSAKVFWYR
jgi:hypothetical protein